jgi:hypothetical protein
MFAECPPDRFDDRRVELLPHVKRVEQVGADAVSAVGDHVSCNPGVYSRGGEMSEVSASPVERARPALTAFVAPTWPRGNLRSLSGFAVVDLRGRVVGRVRKRRFRSSGESSRAVTVRYGFLGRRHCLLRRELIEQIDAGTKVIVLRVGRKALRAGRA